MSIMLANGEKIVKNYDYATVKKKGLANSSQTTRSLTVTNRRIVHQELSTGIGSEQISVHEMPVKSAAYVNTYYGKKSYSILLILGVLFGLFAVLSIFAEIGMIPFVILAVIAALFILVYIFKKDYVLTCSIDVEKPINSAFIFSSKSVDTRTKKLSFFLRKKSNNVSRVKVIINKDVAKLMAQELGSVIAAVNNGDYDGAEEVTE